MVSALSPSLSAHPRENILKQPHWLARLAGTTRFRTLELIQRADRTVQEVADEIGVTPNAVRGHLASLERDGLVERSGVRRDTGGKPAVVYGLSAEADELFPKGYAFVLERLLGVLEERLGPEGLVEVLSEVGARAAAPAVGPARARVEAAAEVLRALGGAIEVHQVGDGWRIQGFACPLSALTREDDRMCGLVEALVEETTGGRVQEVCRRGPHPRCAFDIELGE